MVSVGVTTNKASVMPAPRPASKHKVCKWSLSGIVYEMYVIQKETSEDYPTSIADHLVARLCLEVLF
jgi:hypothetical protein